MLSYCPQSDKIICKGLCSKTGSSLATSLDIYHCMPGCLQGEETGVKTSNTACFGRQGDFLILLPRLPKSENVAVDNYKGEVQIFLGQVTIYIFLLMGFRAFLKWFFKVAKK